MIRRYRGGIVPAAPANGLADETKAALSAYRRGLDGYRLHEGFAAAMDLARAANGFVETQEPWALARRPERAADLDHTLATLAHTLAVLACLFEPVTPEKAAELATRLGLAGIPLIGGLDALDLAGLGVSVGTPLFPRGRSRLSLTGRSPHDILVTA